MALNDGREMQALFDAVEAGNIQAIEQAIKHYGMDAIGSLRRARSGQSLLHAAVEADDCLDVARLLIRNGMDVNTNDNHGYIALWGACVKGDVEAARCLINNGADVDQVADGQDGETPLYFVCEDRNIELARFLLQRGADVNKTSIHGMSPFWVACWKDNLDLARLLMQHGADVNNSASHLSPCTIACLKGHLRMLRFLIENGANINHADECGVTPLQCTYDSNNRPRGDKFDDIAEELIRNITLHRWIN